MGSKLLAMINNNMTKNRLLIHYINYFLLIKDFKILGGILKNIIYSFLSHLYIRLFPHALEHLEENLSFLYTSGSCTLNMYSSFRVGIVRNDCI